MNCNCSSSITKKCDTEKKKEKGIILVGLVFGFLYLLKKKQKQDKKKPNPEPTPSTEKSGSMQFNYSNDDPSQLYYTKYLNNNNLSIGTQSFTIEWFQFWQDEASFPRIFSIGSYEEGDIQIAVSYESGLFYFWNGMTPIDIGSAPQQDEWRHMAIVGNGTDSITVYNNGVQQGSFSVSYNLQNNISLDLTIGNETLPSPVGNFTGNITNFRWVVGTQVYTSNFTPPTSPLTAIPGTQVLLLTENTATFLVDSSLNSLTPTNQGVVFSTSSPF